MKTNKLSAFTLMEMTITMLIAAISIGITYSIYTIIWLNYSSYHNKSEQVATFLRLDELLRKDFERSRQVLRTDSGIVFLNDSATTRYQLRPDVILRNVGIIDRFKFASVNMHFLYEDNEVPVTDTEPKLNLIDELRLVIRFDKDSLALHYHKLYSSENLIESKN